MLSSAARSATLSAGLGRRSASTIALKYSNATYRAALAKSPQTLNKVQSELNAVASAIKDTPAINAFVSNPTLSTKERQAGLAELYKKAEGGKKEPVSEITKNLFGLLSDNGRLVETQGVIEGFNELVAQYKGELTITVTSASPLPRDIISKVESTLKQSQAAQKAKTLKVVNKVNAGILGGLVFDFGDKTIDLSVSSRVNRLNSLITQSV